MLSEKLWVSLLKKILITLLILIVFRFGLLIFLPFADLSFITSLLSFNGVSNVHSVNSNGFSHFFNFLSGGGMQKFSIFSIGITPYIISSILYQLIRFAYFDHSNNAKNNVDHYVSRLITFICAFAQSVIFVVNFNNGALNDLFFTFFNILTLIGGTFFLIFLSELINCIGFGNGISLIIFLGIISEFPIHYQEIMNMYNSAIISDISLLFVIIFFLFIIFAVVFLEKSIFNLPVFYPRRRSHGVNFSVEKKIFIPLKINSSGVISPIFASTAILLFSSLFVFFSNINFKITSLNTFFTYILGIFHPTSFLYNILFFSLITFFCYYYTNNIVFKYDKFINDLKKSGGIILGVRPGNATNIYIKSIVNNLTFLGSIYIFLICVIPTFVKNFFVDSFILNGTSILIIVGVVSDLINKIYNFSLNVRYKKYYDENIY